MQKKRNDILFALVFSLLCQTLRPFWEGRVNFQALPTLSLHPATSSPLTVFPGMWVTWGCRGHSAPGSAEEITVGAPLNQPLESAPASLGLKRRLPPGPALGSPDLC